VRPPVLKVLERGRIIRFQGPECKMSRRSGKGTV
jgi:hypothetical protein